MFYDTESVKLTYGNYEKANMVSSANKLQGIF
jgi:hypothetical protein